MSLVNWIDEHITLHDYDDTTEEHANAATHALGIVLSLAALIQTLAVIGSMEQRSFAAGMLIYAGAMLLLYTASTLYHLLPRGVGKKICRVLDHSNIYILIAGTYTPILVYIDSPQSRLILLLVWAVAASGITFTLIFWNRYKIVHILLYLFMGWMIVFFWEQIIPNIPQGLITWILAGGISYTVGVGFYAMKRLPFYHAVWHLFVLGGSICFYIGFFKYLI
jgi:hemolysin III